MIIAQVPVNEQEAVNSFLKSGFDECGLLKDEFE